MIGGRAVAQRQSYHRLAGVVTAIAIMAEAGLVHAGMPAFPAERTRPGDGASSGIIRVQGSVAGRLPRPRPGEGIAPSEAAVADAAAPALDSAAHAAPPRPRPELRASDVAKYLADTHFGFMPDATLKAAIEAIQSQRYAEARAHVADHPDSLAIELVAWLIAREPDSGLSAAEIIAILTRRAGWPEPERLRLRAEQAFHALGPEGEAVLTFYRETQPRSIGGRMALAGALRAADRESEALPIIRDLWREETLSS